MIEFQWPWAFLALPLAWVVRISLPTVKEEYSAALKTPFFRDFEHFSAGSRNPQESSAYLWLAALIWGLLIVACARPVWLGEPIEQAVNGRDLLMAVDLSGSMQEKDFVIQDQAVDRLAATKAVASRFIERRTGDRIGLILFGDKAYLQAPLTFDRQTVLTFLDEAAIGLAGEKTAIGDAIGLAVKRLRKNDDGHRVLILLTDGANTAGSVTPLKAAELAASEKLKIYTVGIGADEMIIRDFFGARRVNPSVDLDETTLTAIAEKTGGRYFRARDSQELEAIYEMLDRLEPVEKDRHYFRPKSALYFWPLGAGLIMSLIAVAYKLFFASVLENLMRRKMNASN